MIPSRGLRWSSQSITVGRRRIDAFSSKSFSSSSTLRGLPKSTSILSTAGAFGSRTSARPRVVTQSYSVANGTILRYQSTAPLASATTVTTSTSVGTTPLTPDSSSFGTLDEVIDLSSDSFHDVPEHLGYLKSLGLDYGWGPTSFMEWVLEHVHILSGTPWWASIVITAVLVRAAIAYPYILATDNAARMATVSSITKPLYEKMKAASRVGDTAETMRIRSELQLINKRAGIHVLRSLTPLIQAPIGYGTFVLLRGMAKLPVPGLETGGILWFTNLAIPDPFHLLPLATAGILHLVMRKGGETGVQTLSPGALRAMSYGLPALTVAFTWWMPAGLQLSFFVSGFLSAIQAQLFRSTSVRKALSITPMPVIPSAFKSASAPPPSPYQPHIITASQSPAYQAPRPASPSRNPFKNPTTYEDLLKPRTTLIDGFKRELKNTMTSMRSSAQETMKNAKEMTGQTRVDGRRTKREQQIAEAYEKRRAAEERRRAEERDEERRARNERKRQARMRKDSDREGGL